MQYLTRIYKIKNKKWRSSIWNEGEIMSGGMSRDVFMKEAYWCSTEEWDRFSLVET